MEDYFDLHMEEDQIRSISSIGLAHLGDAVYELLVRSWLCAHGRATGKGLHRAAVELVRAPAQAARAERILPMLTGEELAVFKRGRNAHVHTVPHSASRSDYLKATALECLLGYLYLHGRRERINALFAAMMKEEEHAT
ncbi:MAG: ribonuclease III [Oscillospiraceae bacterium]|jgi:ribonuclease-3 family protein|nr:ribonuclease III [Oscillospiraceae bacterium]MCI8714654.1 ribonuclease III [Oscillospiraceae bacterium]MCI9316413.1 ribonuclease III [Oscillospiraceae bacterium]MDE6934008.1 ribonuclease III [Oscillospiraceae bacterium]